METWPESVLKAHKIALDMLDHSHAPYSKLHVGAALKIKGINEIIPGCNVENASFGATLCAERSAVVQAVARFKKPKPEFIVICSDSPQGNIPPCGMCLQVLQEFVDEDFLVYLGNAEGIQVKFHFKDLLPNHFKKEMLPD